MRLRRVWVWVRRADTDTDTDSEEGGGWEIEEGRRGEEGEGGRGIVSKPRPFLDFLPQNFLVFNKVIVLQMIATCDGSIYRPFPPA